MLHALVHACVLFTALAVIFLYVAAPITRRHLLRELDRELKPRGRRLREAAAIAPALQRLVAAAAIPPGGEPATRINNEWVRRAMFGGAAALALAAAAAASCAPARAPAVVARSAATFAPIAVFEYLFFKHVALAYAPVLPSELSWTFEEQLRAQLAAGPSSSPAA